MFKGYEKNNSYSYSYSTMRTNSESFTLYDENNNAVAVIADGEKTSGDDEVFPIMTTNVSVDGIIHQEDGMMLQMPVGQYKIVNNEEKPLTVEMVNVDRSTSVTTSSDTVEFNISDKDKINQAVVYTDAGDTYNIMVGSSDDNEWGEISLKGVADAETVSTKVENGSVALSNRDSSKIILNGILLENYGNVVSVDDNNVTSLRIPEAS